MTGLDLGSDKLIEIAALVTDAELNILGDGVDVVIHADDAALSSMVDVVTEMHSRSGLIDEVRASTSTWRPPRPWCSTTSATHVKQPKTAPLAGNSIATDRVVHRPRHARAGLVPALPDDRRQLDQGALPALVSAHLLRPAGQGARAPGPGRHPRIHPRTEVLPPDRVRAPPGPSTSEIEAVVAELASRRGRSGANRFGRRATERLVSTSPLVGPDSGAGSRPWWV